MSSVFGPQSSQAAGIEWLFVFMIVVCGIILLLVAGLVCYACWRYRAQGPELPRQNPGNRRLEITWTVIPILLLIAVFVLTWRTAAAVDPGAGKSAPDLVITAHQWWWEVRYPAAGGITANEIHIPTGRNLSVRIEAADVIHDFWVPELTRKMDAVPGHPNHVWLSADKSGVYEGACAEFCGTQHAWMRFRVIADDPPVFDAWLEQQARAAAPRGSAGEEVFRKLTCANCHSIRGVAQPANVPPSAAQPAPDLTHVASRQMLAAGRMPNTAENMRAWLHRPDDFKPGSHMPDAQLNDRELTDLTDYLESLR